jgi:hypothetical protein
LLWDFGSREGPPVGLLVSLWKMLRWCLSIVQELWPPTSVAVVVKIQLWDRRNSPFTWETPPGRQAVFSGLQQVEIKKPLNLTYSLTSLLYLRSNNIQAGACFSVTSHLVICWNSKTESSCLRNLKPELLFLSSVIPFTRKSWKYRTLK